MSSGIIYKIENTINGKCYIGQTIQGLSGRYRGSRWWNYCNDYLKHAVNKYGKDNFTISIIGHAGTKLELDNLEIAEIINHNSIQPNGYNFRDGGSRGKHSEESCKKISRALKGRTFPSMFRPRPKEVGENISKAKKGRSNGRTGMKLSEETKRKISKANKGNAPTRLGAKNSKETREKMRISWVKRKDEGRISGMTGKSHSQKTKDKISKSNCGQKRSKETIQKIKDSREFLQDQDVKDKISSSLKEFHSKKGER